MAQTQTAGGIEAFAEDFLPRWAEAWNSREPDQVLALMTDDIVYDDSAWNQTMSGHDDVRRFLEVCWSVAPDLTLEVDEGPFFLPDGSPTISFTWRGSATVVRDGEPRGRIELEGFELDEYRDGKVARLWICFDPAPMLRLLAD